MRLSEEQLKLLVHFQLSSQIAEACLYWRMEAEKADDLDFMFFIAKADALEAAWRTLQEEASE